MGILIFALLLVVLVACTCSFRKRKQEDAEVLYKLHFDQDGFPVWEEVRRDRAKIRFRRRKRLIHDVKDKLAAKEMTERLEQLVAAEKAGTVDLTELRRLMTKLAEQQYNT